VGATQQAKKLQQSAQEGPPGKGVKYHVQMFVCLFFFVCDFLRSYGEHIFGSIAAVFASNNMFR